MLTKACQIAIRSMLYLTLHSGASFVSTREIGERLCESTHFVAKILHQLSSAGLVRSYRGPNGGVALARKAERITIQQVIDAMDGRRAAEQCVLGNQDCSAENPCALHEHWAPIRERIQLSVYNHSLAQVAGRLAPKSTEKLKSTRPAHDQLRQKTTKSL